MGALTCNCPPPEALEAVPNFDCPEKIGQIQKVIIQRAGYTFEDDGFITAATWTALLAAADDTKLVVTPFLENTKISKGEPVTKGGGDNSTLNGRERITGETNPLFTGTMTNVPASVITALRKLGCENLVVFFINEFDQQVGRSVDPEDPDDAVVGIPIFSFFVSDSDNSGFGEDDVADIRFGLDSGWRENLRIVKPADYSPKAIIVAA